MADWDKVGDDISSGPRGLIKWFVIAVLFLVVFFSAISFIMRPAEKAVDRLVQKHSWQYKEGMAQRGAILEANIAEVDVQLAKFPNDAELLAQKRVLNAQLRAITINE